MNIEAHFEMNEFNKQQQWEECKQNSVVKR